MIGRAWRATGASFAIRACCAHVAPLCVSIRWLWALIGGVLASTGLAFPTSRLVYERGPGVEHCPDQAAIREAVASRLGYDPFFPSSDKTIVARDDHRLRIDRLHRRAKYERQLREAQEL
jgi:hypothetical protein